MPTQMIRVEKLDHEKSICTRLFIKNTACNKQNSENSLNISNNLVLINGHKNFFCRNVPTQNDDI